jgi:uncharacterized protein YbaP (TraB family)
MRVRHAIVALALAACASAPPPVACPTYYAPPVQRPFLWKVSGPQGSLIVYATHAAASPADVPQAAWAELQQAEIYVGEADELPNWLDMRSSQFGDAFVLPRGTSLMKLLSDDDYFELKRRIDGPVNHYKPWVAMLKLAATAYEFPSPGMTATLVERARARGIPLEFLETWQEQVEYLDAAVTPGKLSGMIHDYPRLGCTFANRLAAFRVGDDAVFVNEIASADEPVVPRIGRWFVRLDEYVASGRHAFVAIGIGMIVGPYGLLAKFAERGYDVKRL